MKRIRFSRDRDGTGDGTKRRQVKRACSKCRRSKRACRHVLDSEQINHTSALLSADGSRPSQAETSALTLGDGVLDPLSRGAPQVRGSHLEPSQQTSFHSRSAADLPIPFAGPSSARSLLLSTSGAQVMGENLESGANAEGLPYARRLRPSLQDIKAPPSERRPGLAPDYLPMVVRAVLPYLEAECLEPLPPQENLDALMQVYRQEIHPILPIVDFSTPTLSGPVRRDDPTSVLLRKGICLAACKNSSARLHLYLRDEEGGPFVIQTTRTFADRLFDSLKIALDIGLVDDRLELVQLLALMTFHSYGRDGDDEVARLCGQAVHYAYSVGLHQPSSGVAAVLAPRRLELLCSIFALDKIIAMISGRPTVAREGDMYFPPDEDEVWSSVPSGLRALFRLSKMLGRVLDLYRAQPLPDQQVEEYVWDASWLDFEELAKECGLESLPFPLQATLELLYHTVSVMSYRSARTFDSQHDADRSRPFPSPELRFAKCRHAHSSQAILSLPIPDLSMLPFIPYAVSISLAAALRAADQAVLESSKKRARENMVAGLAVLEELADRYWHAESFSHTARQLIDVAHDDRAH